MFNEFWRDAEIISIYTDGDGEEAWEIFQKPEIADGKRFWLVPNEVNGYSLMLPSEY